MRIVCFDLRDFRDFRDLNDLRDLNDFRDLKVLPQPLPPNRKTFLLSHFSFLISHYEHFLQNINLQYLLQSPYFLSCNGASLSVNDASPCP